MSRFLRFVIGTSLFLVMLLTLTSLGVWQLQRLKWKEDIIARVLSAEEYIPFGDITGYENEFAKVKLRGTFHHELSIHLIPRTWKGVNGAHLYTPMTLIPSGKVILVNRGWVQKGMTIPGVQGEAEVKGFLATPPKPGWFTPKNSPEKNIWHFIDLSSIQQKHFVQGLNAELLPLILISSDPFPELKTLNPIETLRNNHLSYAITWFSLAFALIVMYILYVREQRK